MCSRDIEDIFKKEEFISYDKLNSFMKQFLNIVSDSDSTSDIDKKFNKIKRENKINPSKRQLRNIFSKNYSNSIVSQVFRRYLVKKATRSQSGVLVVTVTLSPHNFSCAYDCYYCPQETDLDGNNTQPRSYMSSEPAMRRANRHNFDIRNQFWDRINCYISTGNIDLDDRSSKKMEVILSGGTWDCYPLEERNKFINECYYAANTYGLENDREILSLEEEQKINETSHYRIIGLTIETRPDFINKSSLKRYRNYGVTRVQIGVQHYDDEILRKINRQCYTKDTIKAIRLLKQVGMKVVVHLMPDLPGSNPELDKWMFSMAINNPDLQFDDVKIYPTAVCKSHDDQYILTSKIAEWYENKTYQPYAEKDINILIDVIKFYFTNVNPWVRIQRCIRDIPSCSIEVGYQKKSNLRQMILENMEKNNEKTFEIRQMEVRESEFSNYSPRLIVHKYTASKGIEYHISIAAFKENWIDYLKYLTQMTINKLKFIIFNEEFYWSGSENYVALFGFLRLRIDSEPGGDYIKEINNSALIREVHVYGNSIGVGKETDNHMISQHKGYGKWLMKIAEEIAIRHGFNKISVIAGVGSREYYKNKCGYNLEGTYMTKRLEKNDIPINQSIILVLLGFILFCYSNSIRIFKLFI